MPLNAVLFDKKKLIEHGNWTEALRELLLSLHKYKAAAVDIRTNQSVLFRDCLVIADCESTVAWAQAVNAAVLGYERPVPAGLRSTAVDNRNARSDNIPADISRRIHSHLEYLVEGFEEVDFHFLDLVYRRHHHLPWTVLETERCYLREITLEDLDALYELYRPAEITRYVRGPSEDRAKQEEYTRAYIDYMYRFYGYGLWAVIEKKSGRLIGRAGLTHLPSEVLSPQETLAPGAITLQETPPSRNGDGTPKDAVLPEAGPPLQLGYVIGLPYQNRGYATEVCQGILAYAGENLNVPKIYCLIQKENHGSIHLAEKLGFRFEKSIIYRGKDMQRYLKILQI